MAMGDKNLFFLFIARFSRAEMGKNTASVGRLIGRGLKCSGRSNGKRRGGNQCEAIPANEVSNSVGVSFAVCLFEDLCTNFLFL